MLWNCFTFSLERNETAQNNVNRFVHSHELSLRRPIFGKALESGIIAMLEITGYHGGNMKMTVFCDAAPFSLLEGQRSFGGANGFHYHHPSCRNVGKFLSHYRVQRPGRQSPSLLCLINASDNFSLDIFCDFLFAYLFIPSSSE
jgi:hypothetical protein